MHLCSGKSRNAVNALVVTTSYTCSQVVAYHAYAYTSVIEHINKVALHRVRLVLEWVTVTGFNSRCWKVYLRRLSTNSTKKVRFSILSSRYRALGQIIRVYRQSARWWLLKSSPAEGCHYFPPGLRSPSQPKNITVLRPVPSYTAWWQTHIGVNNLPKVVTQLRPGVNWTHDLLIASATPCRYATTSPITVLSFC